jgi:hypothetical protein
VTYEIEITPSGTAATVRAATREELFADALRATLTAAYAGAPPDGIYEGQVVPIQAVGEDDATILSELVKDCLEAVRTAPGTLHPPRWMAFDEKRVTANLPMTLPRAAATDVLLHSAKLGSGLSARLELKSAPAAGH